MLVISSVETDDSGTYVCTVTTGSFQVIISSPVQKLGSKLLTLFRCKKVWSLMSQKIQIREVEILMATPMEGKVIPTEEQILTSPREPQ